MKKLDEKDVKNIELDMLKKFDLFCKKNHLSYFLCGGTLIGAIRHKGFIPWDDDIDVAMDRKDYNKMIEILRKEMIGENLTLKCLEYENSEYPFAKLVNVKTYINEKYVKAKQNTNIWLDIFPIDMVPDSDQELYKVCRKLEFYRKLLGISHSNPIEGKTKSRVIVKFLAYPFLKVYGSVRLAKKIQKIAIKYSVDNSGYKMDLVWGYGVRERFAKEVFRSSVEVEFEGEMFPAPIEWDKYLKSIYGDYMTLPPLEERKTHSFEAWIND